MAGRARGIALSERGRGRELPLPTRDPYGRGSVVVTALEGASSRVRIEGRFSLGWIGRLTRDQVDFVGLLLARRNNLQQLATDLGISYNTARARFDEIVTALGAPSAPSSTSPPRSSREELLRLVAAGELSIDDAEAQLGD